MRFFKLEFILSPEQWNIFREALQKDRLEKINDQTRKLIERRQQR